MKGYKVFNPNWTCKDFQYEVGKSYEMDELPVCCGMGFHFCVNLADCFSYYSFDPKNKVAEIESYGEIDTYDNSKYCTNKIKIVRELSWEEVLRMVNTGKNNTGLKNSGDCNSGNCNSGNCNSGNWNSGNCNSGNWNSGNCNSGDCNSGNCNSGDCNSGDCNSGDCNSGDWNSGNHNNGDCNSGNCNSGNCNSGNCNSGNWNSGDHNNGDWNKCSFSNGIFNTIPPKIYMFNKPTNFTYYDWLNSPEKSIMNSYPKDRLVWIYKNDMSKEEKEKNPSYKSTGGYLKFEKAKEQAQEWWDGLPDQRKEAIMTLPNFDANIFKKITGIEVRKEK